MKADEDDAVEGKVAKYRMVDSIEMNPENCDLVYKDPSPRVQWLLAMTYESALPAGRKIMQKEGYVYRPSESFPAEPAWTEPPWPQIGFMIEDLETRSLPKRTERLVDKAKVDGIKGLVEIEWTAANMARMFHVSESSIRRMMERVDRERAGIEKRLALMADIGKTERKEQRALSYSHNATVNSQTQGEDEPGRDG